MSAGIVYLLVVKQAGQNNMYRVLKSRRTALTWARRDVKRMSLETGLKLSDRKKYGLAVEWRWSTLPTEEPRFCIVEVYEMPVRAS